MAIWSRKIFQDHINQDIPLSTPLDHVNLLVVDTETTGFAIGKEDRLIEVGAVPIVGLKVLEKHIFHSHVNPGRTIPSEITALTSIEDSDVTDAPSAQKVIERLFAFGSEHNVNGMAGHYLSFDMLVLKHELRRSSYKFVQPAAVDTLDLLAYLVPTWEMKDLSYYASVFETRMYDRHSAVGDALTAAYLFCELCERIKERGKGTWGDLLELSSLRF
ncbi:3'-5' exonuclease [Jeotgalibacillus proteolyticus]|uniref:DNA polymerase III subunit epsilon n=1 Tax=Jeotgalibacillus proteolyticus TaxID=2082395 RepID=A0A2S5GA22_9BACL|nr:3'-5' exonuclease [Jeotgalibacillus proteolyticus]PPA69764.1 DNA polymerase III subunit epsilon [Jeotgalibacillus proteolyticus]